MVSQSATPRLGSLARGLLFVTVLGTFVLCAAAAIQPSSARADGTGITGWVQNPAKVGVMVQVDFYKQTGSTWDYVANTMSRWDTVDGQLHMDLDPGNYRVYFEGDWAVLPKYYINTQDFDSAAAVHVGSGYSDLGTVTLAWAGHVSGHVTDAQSHPLEDVYVILHFPDGRHVMSSTNWGDTTTDKNGFYTIDGLAPGKYYIEFYTYGEYATLFYHNQFDERKADLFAVDSHKTTTGIDAVLVPPDSTAPTTTVSGADANWHKTPVTVTLTATDNTGGSGVAKTYYTIDGTQHTYTAPFKVSSQGSHAVTYWSLDKAGNSETAKSCTVKIDTTGPVTGAKAAQGKAGHSIKLSYRITDNLSPQATGVKLVVKNAAHKVVKTLTCGTQSVTTWHTVAWTPKKKGSYTCYVYAKDLAGNAQSKVGSAKITVK